MSVMVLLVVVRCLVRLATKKKTQNNLSLPLTYADDCDTLSIVND